MPSSADLNAVVDIRRVSGVPCLVVPPKAAKRFLALLSPKKGCGWHPASHSRLLLDRRPEGLATSPRAYQISDEAVVELTRMLMQSPLDISAECAGGGSSSSAAAEVVAMIRSGEVSWHPCFQMHEYIVDEARSDRPPPGAESGAACAIRYLRAHTLLQRPPTDVCPAPEPEPKPLPPSTDMSPSLLVAGERKLSTPTPDTDTDSSSSSSSSSRRRTTTTAVAAAGGGGEQKQEQEQGGSGDGFTFSELFAGIGGFRVGLESLGCGGRCVFSSEIAPAAKQIYSDNFLRARTRPQSQEEQGEMMEVVAGSIQTVDSASVPYHDLLTGGFPCQPFTSKGGGAGTAAFLNRNRKQLEEEEEEEEEDDDDDDDDDDSGGGGVAALHPRGFRDPRGQLFWHLIRLIRANLATPELQPRAILLENVPGLSRNAVTPPGTASPTPLLPKQSEQTSVAGGAAGDGDLSVCAESGLPTVLAALTECGYSVSWRLYDARKVVPQTRTRLYIVAIREDLVTEAQGEQFVWPELPELNPTIGSILQESGDEHSVDLERYRLSPKEWQKVGGRLAMSNKDYRYNNRVAHPESVSNTIRASYRSGYKLYSQFVPMAQPPPSTPRLPGADRCNFRFLTPRECARLQGFPDSFRLSGGQDHADTENSNTSGGGGRVPEVAQYACVGNAVAPPVIAVIARAVLAAVM